VANHEQLSGITVLDLSTVGPASRCTALLRDLGASVVKVMAPAAADRIEPAFHAYGGGRRMQRVRIDLRSDAGREVFLRLVETAGVIVESYRPGVADRLGIGYEACRRINPAVIYTAISGYGADGPYARWAGHDLNYLAVGGFLATQGRRADEGPALPGVTVADSAGGGLHAALAVVAALVRRMRTGEGQFLDVSTTDGVLGMMSLFVDEYLATGTEAGPGTNLLTGRYACYDVYPASDGKWLAVGAIESTFFANLCAALGREDLAEHQFEDDRQEEIRAAFREAFAKRDRDEWVEELASKDTCVAPVLSIAEVANDPHLRARGDFAKAIHATEGTIEQVAPLIAGSSRGDHPYDLRSDQATDVSTLLMGAGLAEDEVARLVSDGVVA
jgi:alpha-methylacyl-CoA racemase